MPQVVEQRLNVRQAEIERCVVVRRITELPEQFDERCLAADLQERFVARRATRGLRRCDDGQIPLSLPVPGRKPLSVGFDGEQATEQLRRLTGIGTREFQRARPSGKIAALKLEERNRKLEPNCLLPRAVKTETFLK